MVDLSVVSPVSAWGLEFELLSLAGVSGMIAEWYLGKYYPK